MSCCICSVPAKLRKPAKVIHVRIATKSQSFPERMKNVNPPAATTKAIVVAMMPPRATDKNEATNRQLKATQPMGMRKSRVLPEDERLLPNSPSAESNQSQPAPTAIASRPTKTFLLE